MLSGYPVHDQFFIRNITIVITKVVHVYFFWDWSIYALLHILYAPQLLPIPPPCMLPIPLYLCPVSTLYIIHASCTLGQGEMVFHLTVYGYDCYNDLLDLTWSVVWILSGWIRFSTNCLMELMDKVLFYQMLNIWTIRCIFE